MARVIKFPVTPPEKMGPKKVKRRKKKPDPEDFGQLNLFAQPENEAKVINLPKANGFFEEALILDEEGHPDAEKYYLLAIENDDLIEDSYCNLGIMKSQQKEFSKSINYLTKCLQVNPRHFEAHYNLANVYSEIGNFELAKMHYEVSIEIEPEFSNTYYNLGLVLISMKEYKTAIDVIDKYIELSPGNDHKIAFELVKTLKSFA